MPLMFLVSDQRSARTSGGTSRIALTSSTNDSHSLSTAYHSMSADSFAGSRRGRLAQLATFYRAFAPIAVKELPSDSSLTAGLDAGLQCRLREGSRSFTYRHPRSDGAAVSSWQNGPDSQNRSTTFVSYPIVLWAR